MNDKQIDELINKALQEEQVLPEGLSLRLEKHIDAWAAAEKKKSRSFTRRRMLFGFSGIAASVLLCLGIFLYGTIQQPNNRLTDTYTDPREAAVTAEKALILLSQNLNKGFNQVDNAGVEIDKINNILNKHLND